MAVINPDDEIFWHKVRQAFDVVINSNDREMAVEVGNRKAELFWDSDKAGNNFIAIDISEITPKPLELITPGDDDGRG